MPTPTESSPAPEAAPGPTRVPISLDTVFRLAEEQNAQVGLARERVNEAYAEKCLAQSKWLPDVFVGLAYYRHEGGIQLQEGPLIHSSTGALFSGLEIDSRLDIREITYLQVTAQRKLWQQKGELSKVTSETLLDAATTYIDLLAARTAEAIVREEADKLAELRNQAKAVGDPLFQADVSRLESELEGQNQLLAKLRSQAAAASAKLIYLLQLDPACELVPVDPQLVPFDLIDPNMPPGALVEQALRTGPGVSEMEGLLAMIHENMARSGGATDLMPILEVRMAEGAFGAGPGASSTWDNRWDLGLQARWNLAPYLTRHDRLRAAQAKVNQAHVAYEDLRGKLTAGVHEAHATSVAAKEQIARGSSQIEHAKDSFARGSQRRIDRPTQYPFTDVLLSINSLTRARLGYVAAVSELDKAQVRLMVLLGPGACQGPAMGLR
jgi:outer membrane protein TolC